MLGQTLVLLIVLLIFFGTIKMKINNPLMVSFQTDLDRTLSTQTNYGGDNNKENGK